MAQTSKRYFRFSMLAMAAGLATALVVGPAQAVTVQTFNTGVGNSGLPLAAAAVDTHYSLVLPGPNTGPAFAVGPSTAGYPFNPVSAPNTWLPVAASPNSMWISPAANGIGTVFASYFYETTFDLTGLAASTASFSGRWAAGTVGSHLYVNGTELVGPGLASPAVPGAWANFAFTGSSVTLNPGLNTLTFQVNSVNDFQGLRVEYGGVAAAVPEPATLALMVAGLAVTAGVACRRRGDGAKRSDAAGAADA